MRSSRFHRSPPRAAPTPRTLERLIASRGERLPLSMALTVGLELTRALEAQHAAGRVWGGLSLALVGFDAQGRLQLLEGAGAVAPEVARGERPDVLSDVYALGTVLYHLLTGKAPQQARAALGALTPAGQLNPAVDGELEHLVASMLSVELDARPFTLRTVEAGLRRVFDELELSPATAELRAAVQALPLAQVARAAPVPLQVARADEDEDEDADEDREDEETEGASRGFAAGFDWRAAWANLPVRVGLGLSLALVLLVSFWPAQRPRALAVAPAPAPAQPAHPVTLVPVSDTLAFAAPARSPAVIKKLKVRQSRRRGPG